MRRPEVRAALASQPFGLGAAPSCDPGVIAGNKHLRNRAAFEHLRPRIMRIFEQAFPEAFLRARGFFAHDAGQEAYAGVEKRKRSNLASRKDIVPDRCFLEIPAFDEALVDAFEPAAKDYRARPLGDRFDPLLP